jgi:hypothetical protein
LTWKDYVELLSQLNDGEVSEVAQTMVDSVGIAEM